LLSLINHATSSWHALYLLDSFVGVYQKHLLVAFVAGWLVGWHVGRLDD